jgi:hypothetical protein
VAEHALVLLRLADDVEVPYGDHGVPRRIEHVEQTRDEPAKLDELRAPDEILLDGALEVRVEHDDVAAPEAQPRSEDALVGEGVAAC